LPPSDPPAVERVDVKGSSVFDLRQVLRIVRIRPGERLHRDPATIAAHLEHRYRTAGYLAARVDGSFDRDTGTLTLVVAEGRLSAVVLEGLDGAAERRARQELALAPGGVLKEQEVWDAIDRLEAASRGAVAVRPEEPFSVARDGDGARLELHLQTRRTRWRLGPFGPRTAGLYNRVDGLNPGLRASFNLTDPSSYDDLDLYAQASIGLSSGEPRHAAGIRRSFRGGSLTAGYEHHELTDTDDTFRGAPLHGAHLAALYFSSFQDYFRRRGHEAYALVKIAPGAHLGLSWRGDTYESLPLETDGSLLFSGTPRPNPAVDEGRMRSLVATLRWTSSGDLFGDLASERESYLLRSLYGTSFAGRQALRAEASYETSSDVLDSDFSFRRLLVHARGQTRLPRGRGVLGVLLGLTGGEPPVQKRLALGGRGTLRGYQLKELPGENLAAATLEWEAVAASFPRPGLVLFYDGGTTWGGPETAEGWRSGAGVGLDWAFGGDSILRIDVGARLGPDRGHDRLTVMARLRTPF